MPRLRLQDGHGHLHLQRGLEDHAPEHRRHQGPRAGRRRGPVCADDGAGRMGQPLLGLWRAGLGQDHARLHGGLCGAPLHQQHAGQEGVPWHGRDPGHVQRPLPRALRPEHLEGAGRRRRGGREAGVLDLGVPRLRLQDGHGHLHLRRGLEDQEAEHRRHEVLGIRHTLAQRARGGGHRPQTRLKRAGGGVFSERALSRRSSRPRSLPLDV
mmetsp:Transcript_19887/g.45863  ORF Transcript_19887/g.45863 Transcript_19887/m.45863 type:complete len:211 (-) Transcript_19887:45-677(-)